jgi:hypothetical protein
MAKYETAFKVKVVKSFLAGEAGAKLLARHWLVPEEPGQTTGRYRSKDFDLHGKSWLCQACSRLPLIPACSSISCHLQSFPLLCQRTGEAGKHREGIGRSRRVTEKCLSSNSHRHNKTAVGITMPNGDRGADHQTAPCPASARS